jgi:hypothetical protein
MADQPAKIVVASRFAAVHELTVSEFYKLCATARVTESNPVFAGANSSNAHRARVVFSNLLRLETDTQRQYRNTHPTSPSDETEWVSQLAVTGADLQKLMKADVTAADNKNGTSDTVTAISGRYEKIAAKRKAARPQNQSTLDFGSASDPKKSKAEGEEGEEEGQGKEEEEEEGAMEGVESAGKK